MKATAAKYIHDLNTKQVCYSNDVLAGRFPPNNFVDDTSIYNKFIIFSVSGSLDYWLTPTIISQEVFKLIFVYMFCTFLLNFDSKMEKNDANSYLFPNKVDNKMLV